MCVRAPVAQGIVHAAGYRLHVRAPSRNSRNKACQTAHGTLTYFHCLNSDIIDIRRKTGCVGMNIDLLFTEKGEAGLIASENLVKKASGIVLDTKNGVLTLEYVDSDYEELNIPVEPE